MVTDRAKKQSNKKTTNKLREGDDLQDLMEKAKIQKKVLIKMMDEINKSKSNK